MRDLMSIAWAAKAAKADVARLGTDDKNRGLEAIACALEAHTAEILAANAADIEAGRANGLNEGLIDRQDLHLLKLLAIDGYTYPEAAKALDSTAEACRKRAKRAAQKLQKLLEK